MYQSLNPYHNFRHAVDVMQATYYFVCRAGLVSLMDPCAAMEIGPDTPHGRYSWLKNSASLNHLLFPFDILALILASIGHDVGHPGVNNVFMVSDRGDSMIEWYRHQHSPLFFFVKIRTATPLALIYNDRSVLESFHAMVFFNILQRHCFQPLTEWQTIPEYTRFRKIVVHSILATDMGLHDDYVNKIQGQWERFNTNQVDTKDQAQADDEIILICGSIIKCADISNCVSSVEERLCCTCSVFVSIYRRAHFQWPKDGLRFFKGNFTNRVIWRRNLACLFYPSMTGGRSL